MGGEIVIFAARSEPDVKGCARRCEGRRRKEDRGQKSKKGDRWWFVSKNGSITIREAGALCAEDPQQRLKQQSSSEFVPNEVPTARFG